MTRMIYIFLLLGIIFVFNQFSLPQNNDVPQRETGQTRGFDLVFVVDVSPGKEKNGNNRYVSLLEKFVTRTYNSFQNSFEINAKNNYYLVTFSEKAEVFESNKEIDKESIMQAIRKQLAVNASKRSNPNQGLIKALDLFEDNFPQKVGIVFLIYNSEMARDTGYLQPAVNLLKKSGFTTFIITSSELYRLKSTDIEILVKNHFYEALNIGFNSPVERNKYDKEKIEWENRLKEIEQKFKKLEKKKGQPKPQLENEKNGENYSGQLDREKSVTTNNQKHTGTGILSFIFLFFLFIIIIAIAYFIFYYKLWKEKYKFFKAIFLRKEKKKEGTDFVANTPIVEKRRKERWLPEYPAACRCKNRLDNREIVAFLTISQIITKRRRRSAIKWLDLCCGNGNILAQIEKTMRKNVSRVEYYGYDVDKRNIDECKTIIYSKKLDQRLAKVKVDVVNLDTSPIPGNENFDIITLLNVIHEINPFNIYQLLKKALNRCKKDGVIVIVDMLNLPHLEWEAVTWSTENLVEVISYLTKDENIICPGEKMNLLIFERKVDIFCLRLYKKDVDENIFSIWESPMEVKKQNNIIIRCLEEKKNMLSEQLTKIYHEKENIVNSLEDWESKISKILWEYRSVCEHLLNFNKK